MQRVQIVQQISWNKIYFKNCCV